MNREQFQSWSDVIVNYIESLDENDKKATYVNELVSMFLSKKLMQAKAKNKKDQIGLSKLLNQINKIKVTAKNRTKLESFYNLLYEKEQIEDLSKEINFINTKKSFPNIWICRSVELGDGVIPGTHIAKLSHPSSNASSILDRSKIKNNRYLTTSSLTREIIDGTYPDARLSRQVKFLLLEHNGSRLFDEILQRNSSVFYGLEDNDEELEIWMEKLINHLSQKPKTDLLSKQIYFPVANDYHLLSQLPSSSLNHKIYDSHFSKDIRKVKAKVQKARQNEKYSTDLSNRIPYVARLLVTQSQPQNVSVLNGKRGGAIRLFSSSPPTWKNQLKPPINVKSWFDRGIPLDIIKQDLIRLRNFILRFEQLNISTKDPKKRNWLIKWGNEILSNILIYAEAIQNLPPGWTDTPKIKLKIQQQYFLDPYRADESFQKAKKAHDWEKIIASDFARWLNRKIQGRDKKFTPLPEHTKLWEELMLNQLREHNQMIRTILANAGEHEI